VSSDANLELDQHILLMDAENQKMMASQKRDLKQHERKLRLGRWPRLKLKLKLPVVEQWKVPAEDVVVEHHHPFEADKRHHLNFLEDWRTNYGKMAEANRDLEVFLLEHVMYQFDFVKVVTELLTEGLNFEYVQGCQVHSVEKTLDSSQLLLQPTLDESSVLSLLQKVAFVLKLHPKDVFARPFVSP
jgi:hypothetical protein